MFKSKKEQEFFNDWYFRGHLDENGDADRQFFYFYALFNHLFSVYATEQEKDLKAQGLKFEDGERGRIKFFLFNIFYVKPEKSKFETFNPLATLKSGNLMQLINKLKIQSDDEVLKNNKLLPFDIVSKLFMEVYNIRCDLFHGSADLSDFNHNKLIDEANKVLKSFLEILFNTSFSGNK